MKKLFVLFVFVGLLAFPLSVQAAQGDYPKAEVFGGYQFLRLGGSGGINTNGWNASLTGNFNKSLGVTADFGGAYKTVNVGGVNVSTKLYTYTGGPVVNLNSGGKVNLFVHALFGGAHASGSAAYGGSSGSASINGFTMMFGGGVDAKVNSAIAVRVIQADWAYFRFNGASDSHNVRISTGIVFRF